MRPRQRNSGHQQSLMFAVLQLLRDRALVVMLAAGAPGEGVQSFFLAARKSYKNKGGAAT